MDWSRLETTDFEYANLFGILKGRIYAVALNSIK